jgi:hypothetical protein
VHYLKNWLGLGGVRSNIGGTILSFSPSVPISSSYAMFIKKIPEL